MESIIEKRDDYVYLKLSGKGEIDSLHEALKITDEYLRQINNKNLLLDVFDVDYEQVLPRKRVVFAMIFFDFLYTIRNLKIASTIQSDNYDGTVKKYADERKINLEVFHTEEEAVEWLIGKKT